MKKKLKSKLILLFVCLAAFFLLGGCSLRETFDEALANRNLTAQVTYYANGGKFDGTPEKKDMYFREGSKALNIGVVNPTSGTIKLERNNYTFDAWYYAVLDEEGKPVVDGEGNYQLGEKVDFSVVLNKDDHWHVVANWIANVKVNVQLVCEEGKTISVVTSETVTYKNGDIVASYTYGTSGEVNLDSEEPFAAADNSFTFVEYYLDEACTTLLEGVLKQGTTDVTVYAKYIEGEWTIIKTSGDLLKMFNNVTASKHYWLIRDIDASGKTIQPKNLFACELQGNGFKISNLTVKKEQIRAAEKVSMFGEIQSTAVIENVTFENTTFTYKLNGSVLDIYLVFTSLHKDATITNVAINGTMTINKLPEEIVSNFAGENGYHYDNCLFGGYANDAAYLTESGNNGFKVNGGAEPSAYVTL